MCDSVGVWVGGSDNLAKFLITNLLSHAHSLSCFCRLGFIIIEIVLDIVSKCCTRVKMESFKTISRNMTNNERFLVSLCNCSIVVN